MALRDGLCAADTDEAMPVSGGEVASLASSEADEHCGSCRASRHVYAVYVQVYASHELLTQPTLVRAHIEADEKLKGQKAL